MKPSSTILPEALREETDFGYLKKLPKSSWRAVVYYEYWRHSPVHIELVEKMRHVQAFTPGWDGTGLDAESVEKYTHRPEIFPLLVLHFLARCVAFPSKPFHAADAEKLLPDSLGGGSLGPLPWPFLMDLRKKWAEAGVLEPECYEKMHEVGIAFHVIRIQWAYTDAELTEFFKRMISAIRPTTFPQPKRAGRRGNSPESGAVDLLNQLAALRLQEGGFDFDRGGKFSVYQSKNGWNDAIRAACDRIWKISLLPLFPKPGRGKVGK